MILDQASSLRSLLKDDVLQKTINVISFIDCLEESNSSLFNKIGKNISFRDSILIFLDEIEDELNEKNMELIDRDVCYLYSTNLLSDDVFKSKYNQEILRRCNEIDENRFKDLDFILIDAKNSFNFNTSKIMKLSDKILIFGDTSHNSVNKILSMFEGKNLKGHKIQLVLKEYSNNSNWEETFYVLKKRIYDLSGANLEIFDLIHKKSSEIDLFRISKKIFSESFEKNTKKNKSFFDFIINSLS